MRCHVQDRVDDYLLERLDPAERRDFERHVGNCHSCREALHQAQSTRACLAWLLPVEEPPKPSPGFYARVQEAIENQKASGWLSNLVATLQPRLAYPLLLLGLLCVAWTLTFEMEALEESVFGFPPNRFSYAIYSEADRINSRDLVMTTLVETTEN